MDFVQQAVAQSHDSDFFLRHLCWRRLPRRAFVLRRGTPTFSGFSDLPASLLASTSPQSLCLPSGHANMLRFFSARRSHCWRRHPRKAFIFRRGTPTFSGFSRPASVIVGVDFLAEPLSSVEARQHAPDFPGPPAALLASTSLQSLCLPSGHANMLRIFPACRKPLSAADRHNGKSFGRYGGFFFSEYKKKSPLASNVIKLALRHG